MRLEPGAYSSRALADVARDSAGERDDGGERKLRRGVEEESEETSSVVSVRVVMFDVMIVSLI